jgi:hypothetical protein
LQVTLRNIINKEATNITDDTTKFKIVYPTTHHTDITNMVLVFKITQLQGMCINAISFMPIREV